MVEEKREENDLFDGPDGSCGFCDQGNCTEGLERQTELIQRTLEKRDQTQEMVHIDLWIPHELGLKVINQLWRKKKMSHHERGLDQGGEQTSLVLREIRL